MMDSIKITDKTGFTIVEFSGEFSVNVAKKVVDAMARACENKDKPRILFDCRQMTGHLSVMDRFRVGIYGVRILPGRIKLAMVADETYRLADNFFENVVVNRGLNLKEFTEFDDAVEWLQK